MNFEYKVKISGDTSNLEKALKLADGQMQKLEKDEVLIKLNYDGNIKNFNKVFDSVVKACPELTVQFQYDIQKQLLNKKIKELSGIEIDGNTETIRSELEKVALEYKYINDLSIEPNFNDWDKLDNLEDKLKSLFNIFVAISQTDVSNAIASFTGSTQNILNDYILIDEKEVKQQTEVLNDYVIYLNKLKSMGAVDTNTGGVSTSEINDFNNRLNELEQRITSVETTIKDKAEESSASVSELYKLLGLISNYSIENNGNQISLFWEELQNKINSGNEEIKKLLTNLGLLKEKSSNLNIVNNGMVKSGGIIGENTTVLATKNDKTGDKYNNIVALKNKLDEAAESGVNVARILEVVRDEASGMILEVQQTAKGGILGSIYGQNNEDFVNVEFLEATDEQIQKLISDLQILHKLGIGVDLNASNIFYDKKEGFSFIDLDLNPASFENYEEFISEFTGGITDSIRVFYEDLNELNKIPAVDNFEKKFIELANAMKEGYAEGQHSASPSDDAEKLEHDFVDGVEVGEKKDESKLRQLGKNAAESFKKGFEEGLSDSVETDASSNIPLVEQEVEELHELENAEEQVAEAKQRRLTIANKKYVSQKPEIEETQELANSVNELEQRLDALNDSEYDDIFSFEDDNAYIEQMNDNLRTEEELVQNIVGSVKEASSVMEEFSDETSKANEKAKELNNSLSEKEQKELKNQINSINKKFGNLNLSSDYGTKEYQQALAEISKRVDKINEKPIDALTEEELSNVKENIRLVKELFENLKKVKSANPVKASNLSADISKYVSGLTKSGKLVRDSRKELKAFLNELDNSSNLTAERLMQIQSAFGKIKTAINNAEKAGKGFFDIMGDKLKYGIAQQLAMYFSFNDVLRYIREISSTVVTLDTNLTELRKVSDATDSQLAQSFKQSTDTAKELGSTISDVISMTADWARLGYDLDAAEDLAKVTTLFKTVGDNMDAENASQYLVSTLQGFKMSADEAIDIVDKYNEVANNFAIDTAGIGEALQRSAASFNAARTDLSESIALVTATNEVVQNPESVGTLWKTVSARIRGAKTELEEMGEDTEGMVESTSKLRGIIQAMTGFDIMEDENTFKSIYDIIVGIGEKWNELSDIDQASLLETLAGKRAGNALAATLNNVENLKKAYESAENSQGSAMKEQENYAKSVQYSIDVFRASLEELASDFLDSGLLKGIVDFGTTLVNILDTLVQHPIFSSTLVANGGGIFAFFKNFERLQEIGKTQKVLDSILDSFSGGHALKGMEAWSKLDDSMKAVLITSGKLPPAMMATIAAEKGMTVAELETAYATNGLSLAFKGLWATLTPLLPFIAAGAVAVGVAYVAWKNSTDQVVKSHEKLRESIRDNLNSYKSEIGAVQKNVDELESLNEKYQKAVPGSKEFYEIANKIADISPELVVGYTNEGDAILDTTSKIKEQTEAYKENINTKREALKESAESSVNQLIGAYKSSEKRKDKLDKSLNLYQLNYKDAITSGDTVSAELNRQLIESTKEEIRSLINDINSTKDQLRESYLELLDPIDEENLTEAEKESETAIRKFLLDYASSVGLEIDKFNDLYDELSSDSKIGKILSGIYSQDISNMSTAEVKNAIDSKLSEIMDYVEVDSLEELRKILGFSGYADKSDNAKKKYTGDKNSNRKTSQEKTVDKWIDNRTQAELDVVNSKEFSDELERQNKLYSNTKSKVQQYNDALKEVQKTQNELANQPLSKSGMIDQLNDLSKGFDKLGDIYHDIEDGKAFDFSRLNSKDFSEAFEGLEEEYTEFIETVADSPNDIAKCQSAFNKLSQAYVEHSGLLEKIDSNNASVVKSMLEMYGVTNAQTIVEERLAAAELETAASKEDVVNKTYDEIAAFAKQSTASEYARMSLFNMIATERIFDNETYDASQKCSELAKLAASFGYVALSAEYAFKAEQLALDNSSQGSGYSASDNVFSIEALKEQMQKELSDIGSAFDFKQTNNNSSGGSGSKEDPYIKKYEEAEKKLKELQEKGLITERERLAKLKDLVSAYFKDVEGYADEYRNRMKDWANQVVSYMESVIGGITKLIDRKINQANKGKDEAIKALEKEKEAAIKAYDAQIKAIDKQIKAKQDEIDAIDKANQKRQQSIDLQQKEYALQQQINQKTKLVYKDGGFTYEADTEGLRDAKQDVQEAKDEIAKQKIQDEIDLLEKEKEKLEELKAAAEEYYDNLIKQQQEYWDAMIDALNKQKDKWQELLEIREVAEAYALVGDAMSEFGYTVEDVLNDTPGAFEAFSKAYLEALSGANAGNDKFLDGINHAISTGGEELQKLGGFAQKAVDQMKTAFSDSGLKESVNETIGHLFDDAKGNANLAGQEVNQGLADGLKEYMNIPVDAAKIVGDSVIGYDGTNGTGTGLGDGLGVASPSWKAEAAAGQVDQGVADGLENNKDVAIESAENVGQAIIDKFKEIFENADFTTIITSLQTALSSEGGLASLISSLDTLTLDNLKAQFTELQSAIYEASSAISGGGSGSNEGQSSGKSSQGEKSSSGNSGEGSDLTSALQSHIDMATGEEGIPSEIALFNGDENSLTSSITAVKDALIGEDGDVENEDPENLIGATRLEVRAGNELVDSEVSKFNELLEAINACIAALQEMISLAESAAGLSIAQQETGTVGNAFADGTVGNAYKKGYPGLKQSELAMRSEYGQPELTVYPDGHYELTTEPTLSKLPKNTVIFNEDQTNRILKNGGLKGKAYAEGNLPQGFSLLPEDQLGRFNLFNKADIPTMSGINTAFERQTKDLTATIKAVTNSSTINNAPIVNITGDNHFDCAGLQPEQVSKAVNDAFMGMANRAYQNSMKR